MDKSQSMLIEQPVFLQQFFAEPVSLTPLLGGLSNKNYRLQTLAAKPKEYFVKAFGCQYQQFGNDAEREGRLQAHAARIGIAPQVYFHDQQGMITDWVTGFHLSPVTQSQPENIIRLAQLLSRLHCHDVEDYQLDLKQRLAHYFQQIQPAFKTARLQSQLSHCYEIIDRHLAKLRRGFCHHDVNPLNLLQREDGSLCLLDWEFAAIGHCDFDLATLLQTFNWSKAEVELFLQHYNSAMLQSNRQHQNVAMKQLDYMLVVVEMMTLLWAIIMYQAQPSAGYFPLWQNSARALTQQLNKISQF